jgi:hypothetical protein
MAMRSGLPRLTTHTVRHLRLTDLARAGLDIHPDLHSPQCTGSYGRSREDDGRDADASSSVSEARGIMTGPTSEEYLPHRFDLSCYDRSPLLKQAERE